VFEIKIQKKYHEKMIICFNIQFALIFLIAMAGGADVVDKYLDEPDIPHEMFPLLSGTAVLRAIMARDEEEQFEAREGE
jgi:arginine repressor